MVTQAVQKAWDEHCQEIEVVLVTYGAPSVVAVFISYVIMILVTSGALVLA